MKGETTPVGGRHSPARGVMGRDNAGKWLRYWVYDHAQVRASSGVNPPLGGTTPDRAGSRETPPGRGP
jgi:hypothetical protein